MTARRTMELALGPLVGFVAASLASTCLQSEPLIESTDFRVNVNGQSTGVVERAKFAADFWSSKSDGGITFSFSDDGYIVLHDISDVGDVDLAGGYEQYDERRADIYVRTGDHPEYNLDCLTTRYFGYAIGLGQVDYPWALMSESYLTATDHECPWTAADEEEFASVYPQYAD